MIVDHSTLRLDILGAVATDNQASSTGSVSRVATDSEDNVYAVVGQTIRRWVRDAPRQKG